MKAFEKMFNILNLFTMERTSLSISEIQEELGYPKSTIFRILDTMERFNYIVRNPDNHRYSLGFNFFRLGSIVQSQLDFRKASLPIMKELSNQTKETVELNILDDISRVCVEKVDSPLDVRNFVRVGERKPAHMGASGKVLVAFLPERQRHEVIKKIKEREVIDIESFERDLELIRLQGYSITKGERVAGSYAVAVPILGESGELVASLTIAGPIQRLTDCQEKLFVDLLQKASKIISQQLGYFLIS